MSRSSRPTREPSQRPVSKTLLLSASMAARAALMRATASSRSYSGCLASPVESSIDSPATPVLTPRATLAPTLSGSGANPPSKSALTGRSTAPHSSVRCFSASSSAMRLSDLPIDQAKPALVEASALNPRCWSARALPTSKGLGMMKHPRSCILRNVARLSAVETGMVLSPFSCILSAWLEKIATRGIGRQRIGWLCDNLSQERPLFRQDEFVLLGKIEIGDAFAIGAQLRAIGFIGGEAFERDQRERDVVGALVRHPVALKIAAGLRDDAEPAPGVLLELRALERIDLVADENGDGHGTSEVCNCAILAARYTLMLRRRSYYRALIDANASARIEG